MEHTAFLQCLKSLFGIYERRTNGVFKMPNQSNILFQLNLYYIVRNN